MALTRPVALLLVFGLATGFAGAAGPASQPSATSAVAQEVLSTLDSKADPCTDFFRYACGGWLDRATIPGDQSRWGRSFTEIAERNNQALKMMLEDVAKNPGSDPEQKRLGGFYGACMDEAAVEKADAAPLKPLLALIEEVKDQASLLKAVGILHHQGIPALFSFDVEPDAKDPTLNIANLSQGGLGLPNRDYYLEADPRNKKLREEYESYVGRLLVLGGESPEAAGKNAQAVLAFETELAKLSRAPQDMRDPIKLYNRLERAGLLKLTPAYPWPEYFKALGVPNLTQINVAVPEFIEGMARRTAATDPAALRSYLKARAINAVAGLLSPRFVQEAFKFRQALTGQKQLEPRWKRCLRATERALGESVGKLFVAKYFPGDSKAIALDLIRRVENSFAAGLPGLAWMDDGTRQRATGKLEKVANKIGYPDRWRDYSQIRVQAGDYFGNSLRAWSAETNFDLAKIGQKVDKSEWGFPPEIVNAFYNPSNNDMTFPAGILQPPFFKRDFPMAMNFGGIGMVMGHELTHGFDDEGRLFDPDGRLVEWWSKDASAKFEKQAQCIEKLYSGFEIQPGVKVNGKLTLGENIADFGGIRTSYYAYKQWAKENPAAAPTVPGLTDDQLFFVGFAQTWCMIATPEMERMLVKNDPHSPARFRVNGPLAHFPAFWEAFQCKAGAPMRPAETCAVW